MQELIERGALFVANHSGGKDSQAMLIELAKIVPRHHLAVIHATLGEAEWKGALEKAREGAELAGCRFIVASATKTLFQMVEHRHATRPEVPSWPSRATRQCTSDLKRGPIERETRRYAKALGFKIIVNCMGLRAQESTDRAKLETFKRNERNSVAGRQWYDWLPIHAWTRDQVFAAIAAAGQTPHWAYAAGNERLSCVFCIMASRRDLRNGARHNPELLAKYIELEERTGYTMHMSRIPLRQLVTQEQEQPGLFDGEGSCPAF